MLKTSKSYSWLAVCGLAYALLACGSEPSQTNVGEGTTEDPRSAELPVSTAPGPDLTPSATIISLITSPLGESSYDLEVIRDGVFPAVGSTDPKKEYDTYNRTTGRTEDWIGYQFSSSQTFGSVVFEDGMQFWDGGWFTSLRLQVLQGGSWVTVPSVTVTPAYAGNDKINFETYTFTFPAITGTGIRIDGAPGGSSSFISVGELRVYGPPGSSAGPDASAGADASPVRDAAPPSDTAAGTTDLTSQATIISLITSPLGQSDYNLEVIRDGVFPAVGSTDPTKEYDTYNRTTGRTEDWIGYQFSSTQTFGSVVFEDGMQFWDGGWFTSLRLQVLQGSSWVTVPSVTVTPAYAGNDKINFETYKFTFPAITGTGIRIDGAPGGSSAFISVGELRVYGTSSGSSPPVDAGTTAPACAGIQSLSTNPAVLNPAQSAALTLTTTGSAPVITWSASPAAGGTFGNTTAANTTFLCTAPTASGFAASVTLTATVRTSGTCTGPAAATQSAVISCLTGSGTTSPSSGCGKSGPGGQVISINVGGTTRTYLLTVPNGYTGSTPQPVYFVYHGAGGNHQSMTAYGLQDAVIGIFPDGLARNGGSSGWDTSGTGVDVAMFDAVLQSVEANYCVDQGHVYAIGFSYGASMANSLGCFRGNALKSFASVEGGILFSNPTTDCKGPIPGWINQYQQDPTVSYATGLKAEQFFQSLDGDSNPQAYDAPNPCVVYTGSKPLVWCTPPDALHTWPAYATAAINRFFSTL